ncbi:MAG TPA: hypothetical protein VND80_00855 [Steroidobacteraceae bacterium]|nr:hypothetical protein [Steroidobacteraceae bacterium]
MNTSGRIHRPLSWAFALCILAAFGVARADDPIIAPGQWSYQADKRRIVMDGTVRQTFSGGPVALPGAVMTVHTTGVRTGGCAAGK